MKNRIYFLDNLRSLMIFLVILYHSGFVYISPLESQWVVVDPDKAEALGLVGMYLDLFVMFTFFFISGYFVHISAKGKSFIEFAKSKFNRIMIPWTFGALLLIPIYKYLFLFSRGLPQEEWFTYFLWFQKPGSDLAFFANNPIQNWLWFLPVLFLFQVIYMAASKLDWSIKISIRNAVIAIIVIGVAYSITISEAGLKGWYSSVLLHFQNERLLVYFVVFLLGSLCSREQAFTSPLKNRRLYIWANVALTVALGIYTVVALNLFYNLINPGREYYFVSSLIDRAVYYLMTLLSMFSILYLLIHGFSNGLNKTSKLWTILSRNSYYVYVIHMIVIGLIALPLTYLGLPVLVKYPLLAVTAFIISNLLVSGYYAVRERQKLVMVGTISLVLFTGGIFLFESSAEDAKTGCTTTESIQEVGLREAVLTDNIKALRHHITAGSDLNLKEPTGGSTPLITAAVFGKTEAARLLLEAGAEVNLTNNEGSSALHSAAFFCRVEIVRLLLTHDADITITNNTGSTAYISVSGPYEQVKPVYDYFAQLLHPLGFEIDHQYLEQTRPEVAKMLAAHE